MSFKMNPEMQASLQVHVQRSTASATFGDRHSKLSTIDELKRPVRPSVRLTPPTRKSDMAIERS